MEKPILFSTPMIRAILDGRKSQTRRIVKPQPESVDHVNHKIIPYNGSAEFLMKNTICPYGKIGDVLWVRETFHLVPPNMVFYKADPENKATGKWKPSIFMPKEACRIRLEITNISVERVQDISKDDAIAEGIELYEGESNYKNYLHGDGRNYGYVKEAKISYMTLWESINGKDSWDINPWVWVIEFKRIQPC